MSPVPDWAGVVSLLRVQCSYPLTAVTGPDTSPVTTPETTPETSPETMFSITVYYMTHSINRGIFSGHSTLMQKYQELDINISSR